jgi:hypothetical protein
MAKTLTINEAMVWLKTLQQRHQELVQLRNENSASVTRHYGMGGDKQDKREPTYDVKVLDKMVTRVAKEMRVLDQQIKATNGRTQVVDYEQDDAVLGELT